MSEVVSMAQGGAVILACWSIISGIGAWKREFIGKRQIDLAEQTLAKFFEVKDAIASIRSPFSTSDEGRSRKRSDHESREESELLDRAFIVIERHRKHEVVFKDFNTLKYRFMASFGAGTESIFLDTNKVLNSVFVAAQMLGNHYWQRQGRVQMNEDDFKRHLKEMHEHEGIFWDRFSEKDQVREELALIQARLDQAVSPCFKEPVTLYTVLTSGRK